MPASRHASTPATGGTIQHLQRALTVLRAEAPRRYAAMASSLRHAPARYQVGSERFTVVVCDDAIVASPGWRTIGTAVTTSVPARAIIALVDGTATLEDLVARDVLKVTAGPDALLALDHAARTLARVGIASSRMQAEFDRYRMWVMAQDQEDHDAEGTR